MNFLRPMSPDLLALGDQIEAAAAKAVVRRRARRTAFLNGVATVAVALPITFTVASADLSPSPRPGVGTTAAGPAISWAPGAIVSTAHIRDEYLPAYVEVAACLDGNDCRIRIPFTLEQPLGKV